MNAPVVVTIYADGRTELGPGVTVGGVLDALEFARERVRGVVLSPAKREEDKPPEEPAPGSGEQAGPE